MNLKPLYLMILLLVLGGCSSIDQKNATANQTVTVKGNPQDNLRYDYAGTFNGEDLSFLSKTFGWKSDVLIINYTLPEESCTINIKKSDDPKTRFERARNWWDGFYDRVDVQGAKVVHVESTERFGKAFGSYSAQYYWDEKGFLLDHFFRNARGCEAVLVVNKEGEFYQQNNHYSEEQVAFYVAKLKSRLPEY